MWLLLLLLFCRSLRTHLASIAPANLLSIEAFVRFGYRCTAKCFLSCQNSRAHPNDTIRHFVAVERLNQQQPHLHCRMYPTHSFHRNPIFQTIINRARMTESEKERQAIINQLRSAFVWSARA